MLHAIPQKNLLKLSKVTSDNPFYPSGKVSFDSYVYRGRQKTSKIIPTYC